VKSAIPHLMNLGQNGGMTQNAVNSVAKVPSAAPQGSGLMARIRRASNPLMLRLAGRRWSPFGIVEHRGRRSGRAYRVPVEPFVTSTHVVIALPWGPGTNWAQNVVAAGGGRMEWKGRSLQLTRPRVGGRQEALPLASGWKGALLRRLRFEHFLILDR
jgi:deazaflavin-dependent oxidoreductase (nitroreductase family)